MNSCGHVAASRLRPQSFLTKWNSSCDGGLVREGREVLVFEVVFGDQSRPLSWLTCGLCFIFCCLFGLIPQYNHIDILMLSVLSKQKLLHLILLLQTLLFILLHELRVLLLVCASQGLEYRRNITA